MSTTELTADAPQAQALPWMPALQLGDHRTDHTHEEFVSLLNRVAACEGVEREQAYAELVTHTEAHFAQEERWMLALGLTAAHCHFSDHASVLEVMREVGRRAAAGQPQYIGTMVEALVEWFPQHALAMDGGLVNLMQQAGYDSATETLTRPVDIRGPEVTAGPDACGHH